MVEYKYKYGIRTEKLGKGVHFGIGFSWYTERVLAIGFLFWEIYVGKVYDLDT